MAKISFEFSKNCKFLTDFKNILKTTLASSGASPGPPRDHPLTCLSLGGPRSSPRKTPTGANAYVGFSLYVLLKHSLLQVLTGGATFRNYEFKLL